MGEARLRYNLRRKRAIEKAAIEYHGYGPKDLDAPGARTKERYWEYSKPSQRQAAIKLTEPIIEAYERAMAESAPDLAAASTTEEEA